VLGSAEAMGDSESEAAVINDVLDESKLDPSDTKQGNEGNCEEGEEKKKGPEVGKISEEMGAELKSGDSKSMESEIKTVGAASTDRVIQTENMTPGRPQDHAYSATKKIFALLRGDPEHARTVGAIFLEQQATRGRGGLLVTALVNEFAKLGAGLTDEESEAFYERFDTNKDGRLSFEEFVEVLGSAEAMGDSESEAAVINDPLDESNLNPSGAMVGQNDASVRQEDALNVEPRDRKALAAARLKLVRFARQDPDNVRKMCTIFVDYEIKHEEQGAPLVNIPLQTLISEFAKLGIIFTRKESKALFGESINKDDGRLGFVDFKQLLALALRSSPQESETQIAEMAAPLAADSDILVRVQHTSFDTKSEDVGDVTSGGSLGLWRHKGENEDLTQSPKSNPVIMKIKEFHSHTKSDDGSASFQDMLMRWDEDGQPASPTRTGSPMPRTLKQRQRTPLTRAEVSAKLDNLARLEIIATTPTISPLLVDCRTNQPKFPGALTLFEYLFLQFNQPKSLQKWCTILLGTDELQLYNLRENQKKYHPQQQVTAFSVKDKAVVEFIEQIRLNQKSNGKLRGLVSS